MGFLKDVIDKSYSKRVLFVNKKDQRLRLISQGKVYGEFYVTTARSGQTTISCDCKVGGKFRNIVLRGISRSYAKPVSYWIETTKYSYLFGVHDASWRKNFGTHRFLEDGSLGCINMHLKDIITVYNFVSPGDWFIIR
ncbi:L,D-transpeptidase [Candidatus Gracilibacteria bacterium]|nr:L,D-transpeptidase [Candidatus Gracilibacteria bacterium]